MLRERNFIERMLGHPKDFRRAAILYDKNAENFLAALYSVTKKAIEVM